MQHSMHTEQHEITCDTGAANHVKVGGTIQMPMCSHSQICLLYNNMQQIFKTDNAQTATHAR